MKRSFFYVLPEGFFRGTICLILCMVLVIGELHAQNSVGIGTSTPNPNAVLDLNSPTNSQGFLVPRMQTTERINIPVNSPGDDGLLVYDLDQKSFFYWHSGTWHSLSDDAGAPGFQQLTLTANILTLDNGGSVNLTPYLDNTDTQQLSFDAGSGVLTITGGNMVDLSSLASGGFSGSFNDLSDVPAQLDVNDLDDVNIGDNISVLTNDAGYLTNADDADADPTNEEITDIQLSGNILEITEAGVVKPVDLSSLASGGFSGSFNDLSDVPAQLDVNDLDDVNMGDNISVLINDAGYLTNADDADANPTNEAISNITVNANTLEVYENGLLAGSADLSAYLDNTDAQTLNFNSGTNQLSISNGNTVDLSTLAAVVGPDDQSITQFNLSGASSELLNITLESDAGGTRQVNLHNIGFQAASDLNGSLGSATLKDGSVDTDAIQDGSIISGDIQDNTITANDIANNAIGTNEIADGAVTNVKISNLDPSKLNQEGAVPGQVLKWNGAIWAPADDNAGVVSVTTSFLSIDPSDFMTLHVDDQERDKSHVIIFESENTFVTVQQASRASRIIAPVHLPHGATITEVSLYYMDDATEDIDFSLIRKAYTGTNQTMASWTSSIESPGINTQTFNSFTGAVIDNSTYSYRIVVDLDPSTPDIKVPADADVRIYGIRIAYTHP